ncbi:Subtilase family protein [Striga hermonthica]|uniref:Subtilase family protein n=1 Tax=Striga hermonthica TaxID=68872 RepID=A0A9N7R311_STRHE|nr:Subtilase family protein [Striga hermonthica]
MAATVETLSVIDEEGHGTHTASTAAGAVVPNVSFFGYASGTASGMAPYARLAAYKVCGKNGCSSTDILAGIEGAIQDGVDVLSMSLGGPPTVYYEDPIALGTFAAMEKGIFVSCSAGNSGPGESTVSNGAPWIMTVGASTIDRNFPGYVTLGNNKSFTGVSLYSGKSMGKELVELVYGNLCKPRSLDAAQVKGKVVVCDRENNHLARLQKGAVVKSAGGMGMILANTKESGGEGPVVDSHVLPAVAVGLSAGNEIRNYVKTDKNPMAVLSFGGTMVNVKPAPVVAAFSSRGPNNVTREILKPDVIGPGVGILAAWTEAASISGLPKDPRRSPFNIISGTSMSCPHISGLAALVKAAHPDWSPSAIKSALMTTAYTLDNNNNSPISDANDKSNATPHAMGAGHVDPIKALSPGLVYNTTLNDYLAFLCSLGYSPKDIQTITKSRNLTCAKLKSKFKSPAELNYPSFSVLFNNARVVRLTRKLTSVDPGLSVYNVLVKAPPSVKVTVNPTRLVFKDVGDSLSYTVTFRSESVSHEDAFGSILWNNEKHTVTSPVAYSWH